MAETIREKIIAAIATQAATVTTANGYNIGIGANVYRAVSEIDPSNLPAVGIWPGGETNTRQYGMDNLEMGVEIEGMAAHGSTNSSVIAEQIAGDIRKAFTSADAKTAMFTTTTVEDCYYSTGQPVYAKGDGTTTGFKATITIKYTTLLGNPYSQ